MSDRLKVIIDTDIGDDIDDAFALLFAMELGFDIIGITTVFENTEERARICKKLLKLYGNGYENVPVYAGYSTPLANKAKKYPNLCQYTSDIEQEIYTPNSSSESDAADFIIESCKKYGKELTVIAIGPFTNIAKVIEKDKYALTLVKEVVIMGGAYFKQYADWNVSCDVEAAKIMFENLDNIKCLGADVTHELEISVDDDKRICETEKNEAAIYVSSLYKAWKETRGIGLLGVLHDPLAILFALDKTVCKCEYSPVAVIDDGAARGITLNVSAYKRTNLNEEFYKSFNFERTHTLAKSVDRDMVIQRFMGCF